jgi:hypothetical protein
MMWSDPNAAPLWPGDNATSSRNIPQVAGSRLIHRCCVSWKGSLIPVVKCWKIGRLKHLIAPARQEGDRLSGKSPSGRTINGPGWMITCRSNRTTCLAPRAPRRWVCWGATHPRAMASMADRAPIGILGRPLLRIVAALPPKARDVSQAP